MQNTGLTHFLSHLEGVAATSEERHGLSGAKADWQEVRDLFDEKTDLDAVSVGSVKAAADAATAYAAACLAFAAKHGVEFDPANRPE